MDGPHALVVIPARLNSTRLPGKMLLAETGKPLIQHTFESASRAKHARQVIVGTEDPEIVAAVEAFGGTAVLTGRHPTGTDRVAEVARQFPDVPLIVNVQGDEPELDPSVIDQLVELLLRHPDDPMATLAAPFRDRTLLHDPACVKIVMDGEGRALYFSRSPIPHPRGRELDWLRHEPPVYFQHLGIYAYRAEFLQQFVALPASHLEQVERLEQLRALSAGAVIRVGVVPAAHKGIDTREDYQNFVRRAQANTLSRGPSSAR